MAHKKGQGSSRNGRDSNAKRLGVKIYGGGFVRAGGTILTQRGTRYIAGRFVKRAKNDTLFSLVDGHVEFQNNGRRVAVKPLVVAATTEAAVAV